MRVMQALEPFSGLGDAECSRLSSCCEAYVFAPQYDYRRLTALQNRGSLPFIDKCNDGLSPSLSVKSMGSTPKGYGPRSLHLSRSSVPIVQNTLYCRGDRGWPYWPLARGPIPPVCKLKSSYVRLRCNARPADSLSLKPAGPGNGSQWKHRSVLKLRGL